MSHPNGKAATPEAKAKSIAEWRQLMQRYPLGSRGALWFQIATTLSANGLIAWFVATGRMTPLELVVLVAIEAVLLIGIAWLQSRTVPPAARGDKAMPLRERLGTLAFGLVWLGRWVRERNSNTHSDIAPVHADER